MHGAEVLGLAVHDLGQGLLFGRQQGFSVRYWNVLAEGSERFAFLLDEVAAGLTAAVVVLDHRQLFGHVKAEVVVESGCGSFALARLVLPYRFCFHRNDRKILILLESVLLDAVLDPVGELVAAFKIGVQLAGVADVGRDAADGAGEDADELRFWGGLRGRAKGDIGHDDLL